MNMRLLMRGVSHRVKPRFHPAFQTRIWVEECGKWGYKGRAAAMKVSRITMEDHDIRNDPQQALKPYHCRGCGYFHVGHGFRRDQMNMPKPEAEGE